MKIQKNQKSYEFTEKEGGSSKPTHHWLAQYEEESDFLSGKVANALPEFPEE